MALPGSAPVRANSPRMIDAARRSGRRIVEMVLEDLKPRDIMTPGAFRNAAAAVLAVSGSINCIKRRSSAPCARTASTIEQFEDAGAAQALMKQLEPVLDTYLSIYQRSVQPMSTGAVLVERG
jgi:dihydroxy-acid dehydratase